MNIVELKKSLADKKRDEYLEIKISELGNIGKISFSECELIKVKFSCDKGHNELSHIDFSGAKLNDVIFSDLTLVNCNFDTIKKRKESDEAIIIQSSLHNVAFTKCKLSNCRFRGAKIEWSDFRYSEITKATFEDSKIDFCDFYRASFEGAIIFRNSKISNSSLYYCYFGFGATIRKDNLLGRELLQQKYNLYEEFLKDWHSVRTNDSDKESNWSADESLKNRYADAEEIYKNLSSLWLSKGYLSESNWAHVKGKRMERKKMVSDIIYRKSNFKIKNVFQILINLSIDMFFGYGESLFKLLLTYILTILIFAYLFYSTVPLDSYLKALIVSICNMRADTSITPQTPIVDFLNALQTTTGVLITGIFGFMLGNKIRNN